MELTVFLDAIYNRWQPVPQPTLFRPLEELASIGYRSFDLACWTDVPAKDLVAFCGKIELRVGGMSPGSRGSSQETEAFWKGSLCHPDGRSSFVALMTETLQNASEVGAHHVNLNSGLAHPELSREVQHRSIVEALRAIAPIAQHAGAIVCLETVNQYDHAGFFLWSCHELAEIIGEVQHPSIRACWDHYHEQRQTGELAGNFRKYAGIVGHVHFGDKPGRNEPGTGEINYPFLWRMMQEAGYAGQVALEGTPSDTPAAALARTLALFRQSVRS